VILFDTNQALSPLMIALWCPDISGQIDDTNAGVLPL